MHRPVIIIVDDDLKSANRTLSEVRSHAGFDPVWVGGLPDCQDRLDAYVSGFTDQKPALIMVDLKENVDAALGLIARNADRCANRGIQLVVFLDTLDRELRERFLEAGANAAFQRHDDNTEFVREVACMIGFCIRESEMAARAV